MTITCFWLNNTVRHVQGLLWVLYLLAKQRVSSMSLHSLRVSVAHLRLLKYETPLFHQACGSNTQTWTHFTTWTVRDYGMADMALSNALSVTLQTSNVNVSECVFMQKDYFLSTGIQFDCRFYIYTF